MPRRCAVAMPKKRKSETAGLEDVEKTLFSSFCTAANSLSHLYSLAQTQQRAGFQAGERQALVSPSSPTHPPSPFPASRALPQEGACAVEAEGRPPFANHRGAGVLELPS